MRNDPTALLREGEERFAAGDLDAARAAFQSVADAAELGDPLLAEALVDLAAVACAHGDWDSAATHLARALQSDELDADALESMATVCEARGDHHGAVRCLRQALALEPGRDEARAMLHELGVEAEPARRRERGAPRVLMAVEYFHPSVGGSERLVEDLGVALIELGWEVEVVTTALAARTTPVHRGIVVHEVESRHIASVAELALTGRYDAVLAFASPLSWPLVSSLSVPHPRPRIVVVPCVNEDGFGSIHLDPQALEWYSRGLRESDVIGYSSRRGWDAHLLAELGLPGTYLPNAVTRSEPAGDFRAELGIPADVPLLLAVGNLWKEKNHVGLVDAFHPRSEDFRIVVIGHSIPSGWSDQTPLLRERMARDPRIVWVPGAEREVVAAAMQEADLLVLPSLAEATPLVLLEAMSHRLPWIATPTCGSAHDHAGGLIAPVASFPDVAFDLLSDRERLASLAEAGFQHWSTCYSWEVMARRYSRLLLGEPVTSPLLPPAAAIEATARVRDLCGLTRAAPRLAA